MLDWEEIIQNYFIPHATVKICEKGSHCTLFDDPEAYFQALHEFLERN